MSKVKVHITAVRLRNRPGPSVDPGCLRPHRVLLTAFMSGNQFLSKQYENQSMSDRDTHAHTRSHTRARTHARTHPLTNTNTQLWTHLSKLDTSLFFFHSSVGNKEIEHFSCRERQ